MIDTKQLAEMLNDGRAVLNGDVVSVKLCDMAVAWAKPSKPQTAGENIAEKMVDVGGQEFVSIRAHVGSEIAPVVNHFGTKQETAEKIKRFIAAAIDKAVADEREELKKKLSVLICDGYTTAYEPLKKELCRLRDSL